MSVTCIVQARMGSERCPGKSMQEIAGYPVIEIVLRRISRSRLVSQVVLATSNLDRDDVLADRAELLGVPVYRGSETDLVGRFCEAAEQYATGEIILRATGDNVFMDWTELDRLIEHGINGSWDFVGFKNEEYPDRLNDFAGEFIRIEALKKVESLTKDPFDREHVFPYFYKNPELFRVDKIAVSPELWTPIKLDLDYPEDLALMKVIGEQINDPVTTSAKEIISIASKITGKNS
jgi:spore coat polysaccharide biosynthesis protein SpsF